MKVLDTHRIAQHGDTWLESMTQLPTDAVYLSPGGCDIDPGLYGEEGNGSHPIIPDVDFREYLLVQKLLERKQPILGICRGHQIICAAAGGKLIQDLTSEGYDKHHHGPVFLPKKSLLVEITGVKDNKLCANSMHHQAVHPDHVPEGWFVSAWSDDGVIEAIQNPDLPVISVQWHPEMGLVCSAKRPITQMRLMLLWLNQFTAEEDQSACNSILNSWSEVSTAHSRRAGGPRSRYIPVKRRKVERVPPSRQLANPNTVCKYGISSARREDVQPSEGDSSCE